MAHRDLIISFLLSVPDSVRVSFRDEPLTLACPVQQRQTASWPGGRLGYRQWLSQFRDAQGNVVPRLFREAGGKAGDEIGRVAVLGFSNGCIGVDELLGMNDAFRLDTVIACDGIHGEYSRLPQHVGERVVNVARYKNFMNFGLHVASKNPEEYHDAPIMVVTHSSIIPPSYPSTTESAYFIWNKVAGRAPASALSATCGYYCSPVQTIDRLSAITYGGNQRMVKGSDGYFEFAGFADSWYARRVLNNFHVFGFGDWRNGKIVTRDPMGTADHIFQGQRILTSLMDDMIVRRWNRYCPPFVAGFGQEGPVLTCKPSQGRCYAAGEQKEDYFPELESTPSYEQSPGPAVAPALPCPAPPPGFVIVGSADDPCAMASLTPDGSIPTGPAVYQAPGLGLKQLTFGAIGAGLGFWGIKWLLAL